MSHDKPADCPFCGAVCAEWDGLDDVDTVGVATDYDVRWMFAIECGWCHASGPLADTREEALGER